MKLVVLLYLNIRSFLKGKIIQESKHLFLTQICVPHNQDGFI